MGLYALTTSATGKLTGIAAGHETTRPDIETTSAGYAHRFSGRIGAWFLEVQATQCLALLAAQDRKLRILEVGGGHGQLTPYLLAQGHTVVIHGSALECHERLRDTYPQADRVVSSLWQLPFPDRTFDAVIAVRVLAHVENWQALLAEMARCTSEALVVEFPSPSKLTQWFPWLFNAKKRIEGNTRPYFSYDSPDVRSTLSSLGLSEHTESREFVMPMVVHRTLRLPWLSQSLESAMSRIGLTRRFGSPVFLAARRTKA
jgi:ubiquinone/menaquinone biosynthesis C-methylase UbiE